MKQRQNQTTKNTVLYYSLPTIVIAVTCLAFVPAFAASSVSTGPWSTLEEIPSYTANACNSSSKACADATTSGANDVISRGDTIFYENAIARNNMKKNPISQGNLPQLTVTSPVKYKVNVDYLGLNTLAFGHNLGYYQYGSDLMQQSGTSWTKVGGCYDTIMGNGLKQGALQKTCSYTFAGTQTFQMGAAHSTLAYPYLLGPLDTFDYWTGSYHGTTTRLEICTGC